MRTRLFDWRMLAAMLAVFLLAGVVGGPGYPLDEAVSLAAADARHSAPAITAFAASLTLVGSAPVVIGVAVAGILWLLLKRRPVLALTLALTATSERLLVEWVKATVARPRPIMDQYFSSGMAYPSGHSANSMATFLTVVLLVATPRFRWIAASFACSLSLLVGATRVYLGVHWPTDVIGGWALGLLSVGAALAIGERSGAFRLEEQHQIVGGHQPALGEDEAA